MKGRITRPTRYSGRVTSSEQQNGDADVGTAAVACDLTPVWRDSVSREEATQDYEEDSVWQRIVMIADTSDIEWDEK